MGLAFFTLPKRLSLAEMKGQSVNRGLHTDLSGEQTQTPEWQSNVVQWDQQVAHPEFNVKLQYHQQSAFHKSYMGLYVNEWLQMGCGLMIGFIGLFDRVQDYNLKFNITHTHIQTSVHSHICTSRCLVVASKGRHSLSSGFPNYPQPQLPASPSNSSQWLNLSSSLTHWLTNSVTHQPTTSTQQTVLLITSQHGPHRQHHSIIAVQLLPRKHACLWSRYSAMAVV
jgi:hypothetical protein